MLSWDSSRSGVPHFFTCIMHEVPDTRAFFLHAGPKACNGFAHSNAHVRDAARHLTVVVHAAAGAPAVEKYLTELRPKQREEYEEVSNHCALLLFITVLSVNILTHFAQRTDSILVRLLERVPMPHPTHRDLLGAADVQVTVHSHRSVVDTPRCRRQQAKAVAAETTLTVQVQTTTRLRLSPTKPRSKAWMQSPILRRRASSAESLTHHSLRSN
jgi:hypothetical protein